MPRDWRMVVSVKPEARNWTASLIFWGVGNQ